MLLSLVREQLCYVEFTILMFSKVKIGCKNGQNIFLNSRKSESKIAALKKIIYSKKLTHFYQRRTVL